jgi:BirA family biotin operon repressor/biotin-[acetyl-CoA-carboxylase] ligase
MTSADLPTPPIIYLEETASTNRYVQEAAEAGTLPDGSVIVVAACQTAGRGQAGNAWEAEAGKNLTCSLLFYPRSLHAAQSFAIAQLAALSIKQIIDPYTPHITLKWPNDVYHGDRKIAGVLIENLLAGSQITRSIIGIGLNLNQTRFRSDAPNPVSLAQITGRTVPPLDMIAPLQRAIHLYIQQLESDGAENIHHQYLAALYRREGSHPFQDAHARFHARIHHIEPSGLLVLERADGSLASYTFKEVKFL